MATLWGAYAYGGSPSRGQRVGIDFRVLDDVTEASPSYVVEWLLKQQTNLTATTVDGTGIWEGHITGSNTIELPPGAVREFDQVEKEYVASWDGTQQFTTELYGTFTWGSGTSFVQRTLTVPRRPTAAPSQAPQPTTQNITSTGFEVHWGDFAPGSGGFWRGPTDGRSVRVQVSQTSDFSQIVHSDTYDHSDDFVAIEGLSRAKQYYIRTRFFGVWWDGTKTGAFSTTRTVTTLPEAPSVPHSYTAQEITRNSASGMGTKIADNGGQAPDDIRVQWNTSATEVGAELRTMGSWVKTRMTDLTSGTEYFFRHAAHNSAGWSDWGAWVSFTTIIIAPDDPAPVTFGTVTDTTIEFDWVEPALNGATLDGYRLRIATDSAMANLVRDHVQPPSVVGVGYGGFIPGTTYWADIQALASPDNSGASVPASVSTTGSVATLFPHLNVGDVWYSFVVWLNVAGVWKQVNLGLNVAGVWKEST
jgi:hypothetical protein